MPWADELQTLRGQLQSGGFYEDLADAAGRRRRLENFAGRLGVEGLLNGMNEALLDGAGSVVVSRSWHYDFDDELAAAGMEDGTADEIVYVLFWHDGDPAELRVRVGVDHEDDGFVIVEEVEVDLDGDDDDDIVAVQEALLDGFRDLAEVDDD